MIDNPRRAEIIQRQPSYVWPVLLIGLGLIWLLRTVDIFSNANLAILLRLWPVFLIILGADLLLRHESRRLAQFVAFGGVGLIAALMIVGPAVGLWQVTTKTFEKTEAIDTATAATITVNLAAGTNTVSPVSDTKTLFNASLSYLGDVNYNVSGTQAKVITLDNRLNSQPIWDLLSADLHMNIGLSSQIPMSLNVANGSGSSTLNLTDLKLTALNITSGSGTITASLPASQDRYSATITGGSGIQTINIPANTSLDLVVTGGSGTSRITIGSETALNLKYMGGSGMLTVDIPDGAAVHIDASAGSGAVFVSGVPCAGANQCRRDNGVWESAGFSTATHQIYLNINIGSGSVTIR